MTTPSAECVEEKTAVEKTADDHTAKHSYKRDPSQRVFVGRNLRMEKIRFFGFDMDYTLAHYKSPDYEIMLFNRTIEKMISMGYPEDMRKFTYDINFPVRGLWFDQLYGNLLKVDGFGNILTGLHGFRVLKPHEIDEFYPNKFLHLIHNRVIVLNTLFQLSDTCILANLVHYFDSDPNYKPTVDKTGVRQGDVFMSYKSIAQDLQAATNTVHNDGEMKRHVLENLEKYVVKDERIKPLLNLLRKNGSRTFLLTNSEYYYTNGIMRYLIGEDWTSYFDISVVDAKKPQWFAEGTVFRQVDVATGSSKIGVHTGPLQNNQVYAGGSCDAFRVMCKVRGKEVLYIGDHIFGDVLRSKKARGWRTFLVVPELEHELTIWTERHGLFEQLAALEANIGKMYKNLDGTADNKCQSMINDSVMAIRKVTHEMDQAYGKIGSLFRSGSRTTFFASQIGSLFRSGSRTTFFASQVERYADIYASSCYNLIYYPVFYFFRAPMMLMPHESTVDHCTLMKKSKSSKRNHAKAAEANSLPTQTSFCHEEEDDDPVSEEETRVGSPSTSDSEAITAITPLDKSFSDPTGTQSPA
uniref:Cytosolic purine 5'-nucleotidase n=1 Tax=Steinernema glaseri TaxID=37863 RepID=A0A1I8AAM7_9BILA